MGVKKHGITIGMQRVGDDFFLTLKGVGKLTHDDYNEITPLIDASLEGIKHPKIKALFDATEFDGWELRAAWDDFKIGLKHGSEFVKIAIYGNRDWQEMASKIGSWFIGGEMKYFENEKEALSWLNEETN
jgi:hypothetical protein